MPFLTPRRFTQLLLFGSFRSSQLVRPGFGLLACDESTGTVGARLESIGVENTFENRATWRELLFTAPDLNKYISGCILFEETLFQDGAVSGKPHVEVLQEKVRGEDGQTPLATP